MSAYFQGDANRDSKNASRRGNQPARRRRFTLEHKREIVEGSMKPGASVSRAARDLDVNTNQVFKWRRLYERGLLGAARKATPMLPVKIEQPLASVGRIVVQEAGAKMKPARTAKGGSMEIELRGGRVTVRGVLPACTSLIIC